MFPRMKVMLVTLSIFVASAVGLFAHDDFRVVGTITKRQTWVIDVKSDVKSKKETPTSIALSKDTVVFRDQKKVSLSELKTGRTVVVDAYGDSEADLVALRIQIVPPIAAKK